MTQPSYSTIEPFVANGDTNTDIANVLSAITETPISADTARTFFVENDWWLQGHDGPAGDFEDAWDDPALPDANLSRKVLDEIWNVVFQRARSDMGTTPQLGIDSVAKNVQSAPFIKDLITMLVTNGYTTLAKANAFYALGGGLRFPAGVSAAEVQQAIDDEAARVAAEAAEEAARQAEQARQDGIQAVLASIQNTWINPALSDGVSTGAEVQAAIKAGL